MRKTMHRSTGRGVFNAAGMRFESNVENCKRRRALPRFGVDLDSQLFFERILSVQKIRDFVFIANSSDGSRH